MYIQYDFIVKCQKRDCPEFECVVRSYYNRNSGFVTVEVKVHAQLLYCVQAVESYSFIHVMWAWPPPYMYMYDTRTCTGVGIETLAN